MKTEAVVGLLQLALAVLTERFLTLLAMMLTFALFAWAVYVDSSTPKIIAASLFAGGVFLPVLLIYGKQPSAKAE